MRTNEELTAYEHGIVRAALLKAQSKWLSEADNADTLTLRTVARVIADAFQREADAYKTKEVKDHDLFFGDHTEDELGTAASLHDVGEESGNRG